MKSKLLAIAAILAAIGSGVVFVTWNDPQQVDEIPWAFGNLEVVDRSQCTVSACNTQQCTAALNLLADGGVTDATMRHVDCPVRFGARARAQAADAGMVLALGADGGIAKYQHVRLIAMRRGALGIAVDDAGWPVHAVVVTAQPCAWKPTAGAACTKSDGGNPGVENTMQSGAWVGAGCVRKSCVEVAGESSAP